MNTAVSVLVFVCCLLLNLWASAADLGLTKAVLDNGLTVIVKTDRRAPVFISQLWYRVGAVDERRPLTGISHMLEHMMFKGTKNFKAGEFSRIIARNGGSENAFTSRDFTAYYQTMHRSKLALSLRMEADRMRHLLLDAAEFEKERLVVIEERRLRIEDNPNAKVAEHLQLISFAKEGAYHTPIIGFQADIEDYKLSDLQHWYEKYYAPNNAALVVVGDVNPQQVIALAKQYFGAYQANPNIGKQTQTVSIALKGGAKILKLKAKLPFYTMSFSVPSLKTVKPEKTAYALEMLAYVLDNGLSKSLIRQSQIANSISVGYRIYNKYDTLFTLSFTPAQGISTQTVLAAIKKQVRQLIDNPALIKHELSRTKAQIEADFVYLQDKISTQSYYLGLLWATGLGVDELFSYVDKTRAIGAQDIANVAKQYLLFENANTVELIPQEIK